jgi:hypothetical protein
MQKHQQNLKRLFATLAITGCAAFASVYLMLSSANAPCHNSSYSFATSDAVSTHQLQKGNANVDALCNRNSQQINWVTWLFKQPESAQFHFVDLLELLERNP